VLRFGPLGARENSLIMPTTSQKLRILLNAASLAERFTKAANSEGEGDTIVVPESRTPCKTLELGS
jgi:hypothetical protein